MTDHIINDRIRAEQLRVIDGEENLGVLSRAEALDRARSQGLDIILIAPQANPPVAKILDYNKFLYEERKRKSVAKARSKKSEVKELRLSPVIGEGDLVRTAERAKEFIKDGNRVKISIVLKGREAAYPHVAMEKIHRFTKELEGVAKLESEPKQMGNTIIVVYLSI